jgi:hypothetical protein
MNAVMWDAIRRMHPSHVQALATSTTAGLACDLCQNVLGAVDSTLMQFGCSGAPVVEVFSDTCAFVFGEPPNFLHNTCMQFINQQCPVVLNLLKTSLHATPGEICAAISMC